MKNKGLFRRWICMMAAFCLSAACCVPALAAGKPYSYTIRVFSGQQGTILGEKMLVLEKKPGERISLDISAVKLNDDSKYYVKGFRESGKGTEEVMGVGSRLSAFVVTKDMDYVVAYGLKGNMVEYTVHYQDADGNTLAPSETYMGNVGDRPVVAYLYVEGYQPQSYNLTKTLSENPMENILTFVYTRVTAPSTSPGGGTTTVINGGGATVITPSTPPTATTPPEGDDGENPEEPQNPEEGGDEAEPTPVPTAIPDGAVPETAPTEPPELIDLDDGSVPLANVGGDEEPSDMEVRADGKIFWQNIPMWAKALLGVLILGAITAGLWFLLFFRKKREEEDSRQVYEGLEGLESFEDLENEKDMDDKK